MFRLGWRMSNISSKLNYLGLIFQHDGSFLPEKKQFASENGCWKTVYIYTTVPFKGWGEWFHLFSCLAVSGQDSLQRQQIIGCVIPACTMMISPKIILKTQKSRKKYLKSEGWRVWHFMLDQKPVLHPWHITASTARKPFHVLGAPIWCRVHPRKLTWILENDGLEKVVPFKF